VRPAEDETCVSAPKQDPYKIPSSTLMQQRKREWMGVPIGADPGHESNPAACNR